MDRGQVSIDLIITILVAMLFVQLMGILMEDMVGDQQKISIRSQGRAILNEVARLYTLKDELWDGGTSEGLEINNYAVPFITQIGNRNPLDCVITANATELTMTVDIDGDGTDDVTITRPTADLTLTFPVVGINCGDTINIG